MSIDSSGSRGMEANSFDQDVFFTLWFHSINLYLLGAGVCKDNQGTANKEEAENTSTGKVDKPSIGKADAKKNPDLSGANIEKDPSTSKADKLVKGRANGEKSTGRANIEKDPGTDRADKPSKGGADGKE